MGKRGPKPQPSRITTLLGNPSKRPLNANEPRPAEGAPKCPSWLPKAGKSAWRYYVKVLDPIRLLTQADRDTLAALCLACWKMEAATRALDKDGLTVAAESGYVMPHPSVAMQRDAMVSVAKFSSLFGLDPSSRSRIVAPPKEERVDSMEAFLSGDGSEN